MDASSSQKAWQRAQMPDLKTGQIHWEAKHEKVGPYNAEAFEDMHAQVTIVSFTGSPRFGLLASSEARSVMRSGLPK